MSNSIQIQPIEPIEPINQVNINIIAFTYVIRNIYPDLYQRSMRTLGLTGILHMINITQLNYNNDEINKIIEIFKNAFNYILIRDMIFGAINNDQTSLNQLIDIDADLFNIIQTIRNDHYGNIFLTHVLDNM